MQATSALDLPLVVAALPFPAWSADDAGSVTGCNAAWSATTGLSLEATRGDGWLEAIETFGRAGAMLAWDDARSTGQPLLLEVQIQTAVGTPRWTRWRAVPIRDASGRIAAWLGSWTDIDSERRGADRLRIVAEANAALAETSGLEGTLGAIVRAIVPQLADWATVHLLEGESMLRLAAGLHHDSGQAAAIATILHSTIRLNAGAIADSVRFGEPQVVPFIDFALAEHDMRANGLTDDIIRAYRRLGFGSTVLVPLIHRGRTIGVLRGVRTDGQPPYDGRDVGIFGDLASAAAAAIASAQIFDALLDSERHLAVVSRASDELARSLSLADTYSTFVRIVVPDLADYAAISIRERESVRTVASTHRDATAHADIEIDRGVAHVIESGRPEIRTLIDSIGPLGLRSRIDVPLTVEGETFGVLSVGSTTLHQLFTSDDLPLFGELARRAAAAIANARRFEREHLVADALQHAALPRSLPDTLGYRFSGYYAPGRSEMLIGGDWYDALRLADGRIVISIGDVLGSGLDAAVTMGNLRQIIRGVAHVHPDPALMLDAADKTLRADRPDRLATALVAVLDPVTSLLTYASAGHPPAVLRAPDGTFHELRTTGLPLGLFERDRTETRTVTVAPGSIVLFATDGLTESTRDVIEGERRVRAALNDPKVRGSADPARAIHDHVLFDGSHDDVALLTVIAPDRPSEAVLHRRFASSDGAAAAAARHAISEVLAQRGATVDACFAAELVTGELLGNVARYAAGPIDVILDASGDYPVLHVLDEGEGFRYLPRLPDDTLSERGRGLFVISQLTIEFSSNARAGRGAHARAVLDTL